MQTRPNFSKASIFLLLLCLVSGVNSQTTEKTSPTNQIKDAPTIAAELRELYKIRDFEGGYELGQKTAAQFPENTELQAWFIVNMARNEMSKEAVEAAKKLVENNKENAWAQFALANAYIRNSQTKEAVSAT